MRNVVDKRQCNSKPWARANLWRARTRAHYSGVVQRWARQGSSRDAYSGSVRREGRAGDVAGGDDEEDDDEDDDDEDEEEAYESPEDPFPPEIRRRPTEENLDKDFNPNEEVQMKPYFVNFANALIVL